MMKYLVQHIDFWLAKTRFYRLDPSLNPIQCISVATGSEFPVPGRFRVLQSRVRAGYGYTLKFEARVPGTLRVIDG